MSSEDQKIAEIVAKFGWYVVSVTDSEPPFSYTCGIMTSYHHPELIIVGLETEEAYAILAAMVEEIKNGKNFATPGVYESVLPNQKIAILLVHPTQHQFYLGYAMGHCRHMHLGELDARQVLWPDNRGNLPSNPNCDVKVARYQPFLDGEVPAEEIRAFRSKFRSGHGL